MQTLWAEIDEKKYYFGKTGVMRTSWQTISSKTYYFGANGIMRTGWQTINTEKYYFGTNGVMRTGWQTISNYKYYFDKEGIMIRTGGKTIGGKMYFFDYKGHLLTNGYFYTQTFDEDRTKHDAAVHVNASGQVVSMSINQFKTNIVPLMLKKLDGYSFYKIIADETDKDFTVEYIDKTNNSILIDSYDWQKGGWYRSFFEC